MLDADTLNPGKINYFIPPELLLHYLQYSDLAITLFIVHRLEYCQGLQQNGDYKWSNGECVSRWSHPSSGNDDADI